MIRITRSLALLLLAALAAFSIGGTPAFAAAPVVPWASIAFNGSADTNTPVLIVSGTLPATTKLPAVVEVATPAGSTLQWAGEILGGDASKDIEVKPTKTSRDGLDIYTFTMSKALTAQVEVSAAPPVTVAGDLYTVNFSQKVWADVPVAGMAVQIPASAQLSTPPTGTAGLAPGPTGFQFYQQDFTKVKKGDVVNVTFSYKVGTGSAAGAKGATGGSTSSLVVPILLIGIAAAVGYALFMGVRRKLADAEDADEYEYDDKFDEEEYEDEGAFADADEELPPPPAPRKSRKK